MRRARDQRGFSLAEVLVSTVIALWLALILHEFHRAVSRSVWAQEQRSQAQQIARVAADLMARELRVAGYGGNGVALATLRVAAPDQVEVQADLNGDGDTADANEIVGYRYDPTKQALMRSTGGGSPQPLVDHVPSGAFSLLYRDEAGTPLTGTLDAAARAQVREVEIHLGVEFPADPTQQRTVLVTHIERVQLRNAGL